MINDGQVTICPNCQKNPCVCSNANNSSQKTTEQKTRIKGSHRNAKPPRLKWI